MTRPADLSIRVKFFGLMSLLLIALLLASGIFTYQRQKAFVLRFAVDNARSLAAQLIETREYMSSVVRDEPEKNYNLVPQVVATQVAKRVTRNSKFYVRQVSLRYRNPENRPDAYETAQLKRFIDHPDAEAYDIVDRDGTKVFRYLQPMRATASCLECHGSYESAPDFVRKRFPRGHYSYDYKVGEVIGAVSVTIPVKDLYAQLGANLKLDMLARGLVFLFGTLLIGILMSRQIVEPVRLLSDRITEVTRSGEFGQKLPQKSRDEIGMLIGAFNDMMDELSRRAVQSRESDERYRRFIEVAASAVITFLKDGKIVIANEKAELLFGRNRLQLLGESVFDYLEKGAELKERIERPGEFREETTRQLVLNAGGRRIPVEMVVSASTADREPLFTAILRERSET